MREGAFARALNIHDTGILGAMVRETVKWDQSSNLVLILGPYRNHGKVM